MDRQAELEQHIEWLGAALDQAEPAAVAGLLRERRLTLDALAAAGKVGTVRNDIAAARQKRRASAAATAQAAAKRNVERGG
jgi:hypothetical protein